MTPDEFDLTKELLPYFFTSALVLKTLIIGVALFALSWVFMRPWFNAPLSHSQQQLVRRVGIGGSTTVLVAVVILGAYNHFVGWRFVMDAWGWIDRSVLLFVTAAILVGAVFWLRGRELEKPRTIGPRRAWHSLTHQSLLWLNAAMAAGITGLSIWQVSLSNRTELPILGSDRRTVTGFAGAPQHAFDWITHAPTLVALASIAALYVWALAANAAAPSQSVSALKAIARLISFVVLGGLTLGLGANLGHVWTPADWVTLTEGFGTGQPGWYLGSNWIGVTIFAQEYAGPFIQAVGVAFLLRLASESYRWLRASKQQPLAMTHPVEANARSRA